MYDKLNSHKTPPAPGSTSANSGDTFSAGDDTVVSSIAEKWPLDGDSRSGAAGILRKLSKAIELINSAPKIIIIQAENPDGDSLGSALALEEILGDLGKNITLYCPVEIPKYMHYIRGWDRITNIFDPSADLAIIVDTTADVLLSKVLETPGARHFLESHPVLAIDHHLTQSDLSFDHTLLVEEAVATSEIIYGLALHAGWKINQQSAENMLIAIMSDSLGLTVQNVTPQTFFIAGKLTELGANNSKVESRRREYMKKSAKILKYKGILIERIEYFLDGKLALIRIPWEEIQEYSDQYNPSVLVLDEMRFVEGVEIGVAIKTYPDGKLTGKLRSNSPISTAVAGFFGGGGHEYAAGFRVYESIDTIIPELITATDKALRTCLQSHPPTQNRTISAKISSPLVDVTTVTSPPVEPILSRNGAILVGERDRKQVLKGVSD